LFCMANSYVTGSVIVVDGARRWSSKPYLERTNENIGDCEAA
jgi:hypothetical protein